MTIGNMAFPPVRGRTGKRASFGESLRVVHAAAMLAAVAAAAPTTARAAEKDELRVNVHGQVAQHCALGSIGNMDFGNLSRAGLERDESVGLSCNVPFQIMIQSAKGGLANAVYPKGQGPYAGTVPYSLSLSVPLRRPDFAMLDRSFTSTALMSGQTVSSDGGIALDGMQLKIALQPVVAEAGLLAGNYSETVTITVAPI